MHPKRQRKGTPSDGRISNSDKHLIRMKNGLTKTGIIFSGLDKKKGSALDRVDLELLHHEAWRPRLWKLRFTRPIAPDQSFMDRLVIEAGWVFRQPIDFFQPGLFMFGLEVESLCNPTEAKYALQSASGSEFDFEVKSVGPAHPGDGEGPYLSRPKDRYTTYDTRLEDVFGFKPYIDKEIKGLGALRICEALQLPLICFAKFVESGLFPPGRRETRRLFKGAPERVLRGWSNEELEEMKTVLDRIGRWKDTVPRETGGGSTQGFN